MRETTVLLCMFVAVLSASAAASAQQWGREPLPENGVCFYKDPNFRGDYFCVRGGDSVAAVPHGMNDKISSLRVFGRTEVTVFRDVRFSGRSSRFAGDVRNLKDEGWDDLISSLRVQAGSFGSFGRPSRDVDRIIRQAYHDILNREPDSQGLRDYRNRMLDDGWSEDRVRNDLRNSPEGRARGGMTPAKAQEIVRRAYLSVLRREPDPGAQGYVDRVMRDHWTQEDVERELRKSDEYRRKR
jgi:Peptidase inhibitor family I36